MAEVEFLTTDEVAAVLRTSPEFVLRELRRKNLRGSKVAREWRVARADLDTYIDAHANVARVRRTA